MTAQVVEPSVPDDAQPECISYLVANYNNAPYISNCLDSLQAQTDGNWRCLICDDGSTDGSPRRISEHLARLDCGDQIRYMENAENRGYIATLRRLIAESNTDIVGTLDPDDALEPDATAAVLAVYAADAAIECVFSQMQSYDAELKTAIEYDPGLHPGGVISAAPIAGHSGLLECTYPSLRTFRRRAYDRTDGFAPAALHVEDFDLMLQLEEVCYPVFIERVLYRYRRLPSGQAHDPAAVAAARAPRRAVYRRAAERRQLSVARRGFVWLFSCSLDLLHVRGGYRFYCLLRWCLRHFNIVRGEKLRRGPKPRHLPAGCHLVGADG